VTFETVLQDLRYAVRLIRRSPGFALAVIATVALGIGANTAIFSVVQPLLLKPLPYPEPERLVMVWQDLRARGGPPDEWATPGNLVDWRAESSLFASLASVRGWAPTLTGQGDPEPILGEQVTQDYFQTLGATPAAGRLFRPEDMVPNAPRVVILSHGAWTRRFGADQSAIGRRITLAGEPHEIVGVLPDAFRPIIVAAAEIWRPDRLNLANPARGAVVLRIVARLAPGVPESQVAPSADALGKRLEQRYPQWNTGARISIAPLKEQVVGDVRPGLLVLVGAVGLVLLIACVNIANLLLARASGRAREMAVRTALGAGRRRVTRQLLTESLLLSSVGGVIGVVLSILGLRALVALAPAATPRMSEVGLNGWVLAFAAVITFATGVLFGLAPALQASRGEQTPALKEGGRGTAGAGGHQLRRLLIVAEVALALILLVGSGLLLRSFLAMQRSDLGFDPTNVVTGFVSVPPGKMRTDADRVAFQDRLLERMQAIPGVRRAALTSVTPLALGDSDMSFFPEGAPPPPPGGHAPATWYRLVSAEYFQTMGMTVRQGRNFEGREAAPVVIVNEALAERIWSGQSALGRRIKFNEAPDAPWFSIIGVVADVKQQGARSTPRMQTFVPYWQFAELAGGTNVVLHTTLPADTLVTPLRQAVREIDPDLPIARVTPMTKMVADSIETPRFLAVLTGTFAALAMLLAALGVYGVVSYGVTERLPEFGVRLALGAGRADLFRLVFRDGLRLTAIGIAIGAAGAYLVARAIGALLYGVAPADPLTFAATVGGVVLVAAVAIFLPARRATEVDPVTALRAQ
jgi:predicted permease